MKIGLLILAGIVFFQSAAVSEPVSVISFSAPPLTGECKYSEDGVGIELVKEIFKVSAIDVQIKMLPRARATATFERGGIPVYLSPVETLSRNFRHHVTEIPLLVVRNVVFYKKSRYPHFSWKQYADLKNYVIGVFLGGASERTAKANGLKIDSVPTVDQLIKKLDADRYDLFVIVDLAGKMAIEKNFPDRINDFAYDEDTLFGSPLLQILVNNEHAQSAALIPKIKNGLEVIFTNGTWLKVMEKYYGEGKVAKQSIKLVEDFIQSERIN